MYHIALTPNAYPANALSARGSTLLGAVAELLRSLDALDAVWAARVLEATQEAVANLEDDLPAKGTWSDMGCEDDAFSIDIFCEDDAKYVKFDDDLLLVPHGAVGLAIGEHNHQEWLYEMPDESECSWVDLLLPHVAYTPGNPGLDALRHHVTGAIERGESQAIVEQKPQITAIDREIKCGCCTLTALFNDGSTKRLFSYYIDELCIMDAELIGKTEDEAHKVRQAADVNYLRS